MHETETDLSAPLQGELRKQRLVPNKNGTPGQSSSNIIPRVSYFFMCYAWIFDFRSEGAKSGLATQQLFLVIYLAALVPFFVSYKGNGVHVRGLGTTVIFSFIFIFIGTISGLIADQEYYQIFRNSINIFIYITMVYATSKILVLGTQKTSVYYFLILSFCYSISTLIIYYIRQGGIDFSRVRFEIIGPSTISGIALIGLSLLYRIPLIGYASMITSTVIVFISITRTFILVAVSQIFAIVKNARSVFGPGEIVLSLVLLTSISTGYVYTEFFSDRWEERVSVRSKLTDIDPTLYARMDEWNFMMKKTLDSPKSVFFGSGFAAITEYYLPSDISKAAESDIGFGHSNHFSLIFIAGLLGGLPLLLLHFLQLGQAIGFISRVVRGGMKDSDTLFLAAWGALIVIGTFMSNILAAAFTNRGTSLWFALGTGLFLGGRACFDPHNIRILRESMPNFYTESIVSRRNTRAIARMRSQTSNPKAERLPDAVLRRRSALSADKNDPQCLPD